MHSHRPGKNTSLLVGTVLKLNKIGLSPFDDKRYILGNGCDSLAYGHYLLRDSNLDQHDQELIELLADL